MMDVAAQKLSSERWRIGMVAHAELGGSGTVAVELASALASHGHEVHFITPGRPFRALDPGVTVHVVEPSPHAMFRTPPWTIALASRIAAVAERHHLDILHAHFGLPYAVATELASQLLGAEAPPWVATLHGSDVLSLGLDPDYRPMLQLALRRASAVTVPSLHLRQQALHHLAPNLEVQVVPNFVDAERFCPGPSRPSPSETTPTLVHASNFRPVKRIGDVVSVFAKVRQSRTARLLLVGDGPLRADALARLDALGLADDVEAPGARSDVEAWLARAHLALLPSERESFGLAALESLACGVPVIGSRVGGLPEVVGAGAGKLTAVGDVDAMSEAALDLLSDDVVWRDAAERARHTAISFSPERALDGYTAIYRALLRPTVVEAAPRSPR